MNAGEEVPAEQRLSRLDKLLFTWLTPDHWPRWLVYIFAVVLVVATLLVRLSIGDEFVQRPLLILFVLPILLSAFLGGLGPGLLTTLVAFLGANYFLIPPTNSFSIVKSADLAQCLTLIITGVLISVLSEALHRYRRHVEAGRLLQAVTLDSIGDAVITTDKRGRITFLNPEAEHLTGWRQQKALGHPLPAVFRIINEQTRQAIEDPVKKVLASGKVVGLANHTLLLARDGREIAIADSGAPIRLPDGSLFGVVLVFHDCTEQRQAEATLRHSLAEKTALLKEVHHRVKNNLQIVASLLSLQASRASTREVVAVLEDTRKRVHSMALLHEALYRSDDLARINFAAYVEELCRHLRRSTGAAAGQVEVDNQVAPLGLPLEQSIPCNLIINELVSNALKHAFADGRTGKVTVFLGPDSGHYLVLRVADNGAGLPLGLDIAATPTLGLRLVSGLAAQLGGQLTVERPEGTGAAFQVMFPAPENSVTEDKG